MESTLILADKLMQLLRECGATRTEAFAALEIAHKLIRPSDLKDPEPQVTEPQDAAAY